jgi:hypothetical protein
MSKAVWIIILLVLAVVIVTVILNVKWIDFYNKYFVKKEEIDPCLESIYSDECDITHFCPRNPGNIQCRRICQDYPDEDICKEVEYCSLEPWENACLGETCSSLEKITDDKRCVDYCKNVDNLDVPACRNYYCNDYNPSEPKCSPEYCTKNPQETYCVCQDPTSLECKDRCDKTPNDSICKNSFCLRNPADALCTTCTSLTDPLCSISYFEGKVFRLKNTNTGGYLSNTANQVPSRSEYGKIWRVPHDTNLQINAISRDWYLKRQSNGSYFLCSTVDNNLSVYKGVSSQGKIVLDYDPNAIEFYPQTKGSHLIFIFLNDQRRAITTNDKNEVSLYGETTNKYGQYWRVEVVEGAKPPNWGQSLISSLIPGNDYYITALPFPRTMYFSVLTCLEYPNAVSLTTFPIKLKLKEITNAKVDASSKAVILGYTFQNMTGSKMTVSFYMNGGYIFMTEAGKVGSALSIQHRSEYYEGCLNVNLFSVPSPALNAVPFVISSSPPIGTTASACISDIANETIPGNPDSCKAITLNDLNGVFRIKDIWSGRYLTTYASTDSVIQLKEFEEAIPTSQMWTVKAYEPIGPGDRWVIIKSNKTSQYADLQNISIKTLVKTEVKNTFSRNFFMLKIGLQTSSDLYSSPPMLTSSKNNVYQESYFMFEKAN